MQRPLVRLRVQAGETHSRRTIKHHPKAQLNTSAICFAANTDHEQQRAQRLRKRAHALKPGRGPRSERHEREERHHLIRRRQRRVQSPPERLRFGLGRRGHAPDRRAHRREPAILPAHADKGQPVYEPGDKVPEPDNRAHRRARLSQRDPAGDERPSAHQRERISQAAPCGPGAGARRRRGPGSERMPAAAAQAARRGGPARGDDSPQIFG